MIKKVLFKISLLAIGVCLTSCNIYDLLLSSESCDYESELSSFSSTKHWSSSSCSGVTSSYSSIEHSSPEITQGNGYYKINDLTTSVSYEDLYYSQGLTVLPASGNTKCLVLPLQFSDYPFGSSFLTDIDHALNGNGKTDTGYWESLSSFYDKSSYGKVHLEFDIAPIYEIGCTAAKFYYDSEKGNFRGYDKSWLDDSGSYGSNVAVEKAVQNFVSKGGNTADYDANGDGLIDGIIVVYSCPNSYDHPIRYNRDYEDNGDLYWAFCYYDYFTEEVNINNPEPYLFFWMSYDFLYEAVRSPKVDAHTLIHECGHMFGLDDYYGDGDTYVTGTMSMMDYNILDLDPFSKVALGWSSAYVVEDSCSIELKPMTTNGEVIIVAPSNNGQTTFNNTPFDEYMLIELYTPDGLNELDSTAAYSSRQPGFSIPGIRLWHVDGRLAKSDNNDIWYVDSFDPYDNDYWYSVAASNTYKLDGIDYNFNLLSLIDATGETYSYRRRYSDNDTLFQTGDSFTMSNFQDFFPSSTTFNDGRTFNFTINFTSVSATGATISFTRN